MTTNLITTNETTVALAANTQSSALPGWLKPQHLECLVSVMCAHAHGIFKLPTMVLAVAAPKWASVPEPDAVKTVRLMIASRELGAMLAVLKPDGGYIPATLSAEFVQSGLPKAGDCFRRFASDMAAWYEADRSELLMSPLNALQQADRPRQTEAVNQAAATFIEAVRKVFGGQGLEVIESMAVYSSTICTFVGSADLKLALRSDDEDSALEELGLSRQILAQQRQEVRGYQDLLAYILRFAETGVPDPTEVTKAHMLAVRLGISRGTQFGADQRGMQRPNATR